VTYVWNCWVCGLYKQATPFLIDSLKKLEYRGYDSAGIAVFDGEDIIVRKAKGALKVLEQRIAGETIKGIARASAIRRWATHGEPSDINAHPQTNVSGTIAVVHNGIIENYAKLKAWLQAQGMWCSAVETDTEVIAHLVNYYYETVG
jgi:glucosamine--fructose-6-phosphate aminotransferase (isomerizing)